MSWFQSFAFKFNLYHYMPTPAWAVWGAEVGLYKLNPVDP
jgi:hypothetical protein